MCCPQTGYSAESIRKLDSHLPGVCWPLTQAWLKGKHCWKMSGELLSMGLPVCLPVLREAILCCLEHSVLQPLLGCTEKTKMGEKWKENGQPQLSHWGFPDLGFWIKNSIIALPQVLIYMSYYFLFPWSGKLGHVHVSASVISATFYCPKRWSCTSSSLYHLWNLPICAASQLSCLTWP